MSAFSTIARARELATGSKLDVDEPTVEPTCASDAELDQLVSNYYGFFSERFVRDVAFLSQLDPSPKIETFRRLLYDLRTAAQHTDNPKSDEVAREWRAQYGTPQEAADALASAMNDCLTRLAQIGVAVTRSATHTRAWLELVSIDTGAIFTSVESDLGLRFSPGQRRRMVRQVEGRLKVTPIEGDHRRIVTDFCVQEMLSDRRPLPLPYTDVLDSLGLLGDPAAGGAVLAAYSVAAIAPDLAGSDFLDRVEETWRAAAAY